MREGAFAIAFDHWVFEEIVLHSMDTGASILCLIELGADRGSRCFCGARRRISDMGGCGAHIDWALELEYGAEDYL